MDPKFDDSDPVVYPWIVRFFYGFVYGFYSTVSVVNVENCPKNGEPTILAFNHGNGLVDAALLMVNTPRQLRFCAKDTLWDMPFWGFFVKRSGAVPVFRPKEHGEKAGEYNERMYRSAFSALHKGQCLAIAPEGVSRFAPNMAQPLKTGPARIALRALELAVATNPDFKVNVAPVGITYTHREKFRSSVLLDYCKPIIVDKSWLPDDSVTNQEEREKHFRERAYKLTELINDALKNATVHSPDFETSRLAMTATRVLLPLGTQLSLNEYFKLLRLWVNVLQNKEDPKITTIREAIHNYQALLDEKRVKDERVRRYAFDEGGRPSRAPRVVLILYRLFVFLGLCAIVVPGLLVWSPVWWMIRRRERQLLAKGPGWNDSVAEMKMQMAFLSLVAVPFIFHRSFWIVYIWSFLTIRLYEELVAAGRSLYTHFKFHYLYETTLADMLRLRRIAATSLRELAQEKFDPKSVPESFFKSPLELGRETVIRVWPWENWHIARRKKKDWNETLRLHDHNTMDYF
jgi:glycerol-3-phosphate O-acyltransferase/dihydroxyacetone phosphate acyltransferase